MVNLATAFGKTKQQTIAEAEDISPNLYAVKVCREHYRRAVCGKSASTVL